MTIRSALIHSRMVVDLQCLRISIGCLNCLWLFHVLHTLHPASTGPGEANTAKRLGTCEHHRETSGTVLGPRGPCGTAGAFRLPHCIFSQGRPALVKAPPIRILAESTCCAPLISKLLCPLHQDLQFLKNQPPSVALPSMASIRSMGLRDG